MVPGGKNLAISGDRFSVHYQLSCLPDQAAVLARHICYEQTVEFPEDLIPDGDIKNFLTGRIESLTKIGDSTFLAEISYASEVTGMEFPQFLNTLFGNISILPGIRITDINLPESISAISTGPRFGSTGIKKLLHAEGRPLVCSALKPLGLSSDELADQAYQFAAGGIDLIKDDHGITNQQFSPFKERVQRCADAVKEANLKYRTKTLYLPNISGPVDKIFEWARFAKEAGAGGLLIAPGLTGWDTMKSITEDDSLSLPVMAHPAFTGTYVLSPASGLSHGVLYGLLMRLAGADMTVFPNYGGRFSFSEGECSDIISGCTKPLSQTKPILPAPGGGMTTERLSGLIEFYGRDFVMLIGGGLHRYSSSLIKNSRHFMDQVKKACPV